MGITILATIMILMLFGFGERLLKGTGVPSWLAFIIAGIFIAAFFIPKIHFGIIMLDVAGFVLPLITAVLFFVISGFNLKLLRSIFAMLAIAASVIATRMFCLDLKENAVIVATLVSGFFAAIFGYFISGEPRGIVSSVMSGVVFGDIIFALIDYYLYKSDAIYLGYRGNYNTIVLGTVFGLIIWGLLSAIFRTFNTYKKAKHTLQTEASQDVMIDEDEISEFNSFFDDEII